MINDKLKTEFASRSDAGFPAVVGANLVFACSWNAKIRIAAG
jgi:hypothetical protein